MDSAMYKNPAGSLGVGLLLCLLVFEPLAWGQSTRGTIFGTITDSSGAVVSGAQVTVTAVATGESRSTTTNTEGGYVVPALLPGKYNVNAQKEQFKNVTVGPVDLAVAARQEVNVRLTVAGAKEQLTVTAAAPVIETGSASLGQVIGEKAMVDMPLNGRNFLQLVLLSAGSSPLGNGSDTLGFNRPSVNISGGRESSNQFTVDGVFNNVIHFEGLNMQPNVDGIEEFKVQRNSFSAEYGFGTAIVNVATRSGTNQFHGTAFEFLRNDVLDAKQFFDVEKPPYRQNQFGGVFGGPIIKNKTFFFFSYDGFRSRQTNTLIGTLPTAQMLSGDFSGLPPIRDPQNNYQPFLNNQIPSDRFSQITQRILPLLPTFPSTAGGNNFLTTAANKNDYDQWSIRVDQRFGERDSVFARYSWANTDLYNPGLLPQTGNTVSDTPVNAGAQWTHAFTGNVLNEARIGFNRNLQIRAQDGQNNSQFNVLQMQNIVNDPINFGLPLLVLAGYTGFGTNIVFPEIVGGNTLQVSDSFHWVKGRHTFAFGGEFRNTQMPHTPFLASRGEYVFTGVATGDPVADFLLGFPLVALGAGKGPSAYMSMQGVAGFIQDDWRVNGRFTLNLGLRYERLSALSDRTRGRLGVFNYLTGEVVPPDQVEAQGLVNPDNSNIAPRIGFSWEVARNTIVRGGFGIYYDVKPFNEYNFSLGTELSFQQLLDVFPLFGLPPAFNWDQLFPGAGGAGVGILTDYPWAQTPLVKQWSLGVQRALPRDILVELAYVGSAGRALNNRFDLNQASLPEHPGDPIAPRRPYPNLGSIYTVWDSAFSNYNSLQARVEKRASKNLYVLGVYTFSKSLDNSSFSGDGPQDAHNLDAEYGLSGFDQRHRFVFSSNYSLPFGRGQRFASSNSIASAIFGGWQFNSIVTIASGVPFSVGVGGTDRSQTGAFTGGFQRANFVGVSGNGSLPSDQRGPTEWFNTADFVAAPEGTFGNTGRNILIGPGTQNFDLSLFKNIGLTERVNLEFRSEFFNAFNKPQFNLPVADPTSPAFGEITSVRPARQIQFGLKLAF